MRNTRNWKFCGSAGSKWQTIHTRFHDNHSVGSEFKRLASTVPVPTNWYSYKSFFFL